MESTEYCVSFPFSSVLLYVHRDHKDCLGRGAQDGHLDFHTVPEIFSEFRLCCFTSTETIRTIRDGEPRTATSTSTQLLSSEMYTSSYLYQQRPHQALEEPNYRSRGLVS